VIINAADATELSDDRLSLVVQFDSGCPPGYSLSGEQIEALAKSLL
jgi:hypothetical protein